MVGGLGKIVGLVGTVVVLGVGLKTIEQIDIQSRKIINPTKLKMKKSRL